MPTKRIAVAAATDVTVCLALDPPVVGCHAGGGVHVTIPPDWFARCNAGQAVLGCNYSRLEADSSLYVSAAAQSRTTNPTYTTGLVAGDLSAFVTKLASAVVVVGVAVADAQAETVP